MYGYIALGIVLGILISVIFSRLTGSRRLEAPRLPPPVDLSPPHYTGERDGFGEPSSVVLESAGTKKIAVIKAVRTHTGLGLKEAKDLVEGAPRTIVVGIPRDHAERFALDLRGQGATVSVR